MPIYPTGSWVNPGTRPDGSAVAGAGRIRIRPGDRFDRHHHDGEELWHISAGAALIEIEGERCRVNAGDIVLFPAGVPHDIVAVSEELVGFFTELQTPGGATGHQHSDPADAEGHPVAALAPLED
ncbi:cupin domain-containing protein [Homoserinibacter sp. GY 40078]|uniref:cupin domain-containing protein n=1 Tax=Homoserinibacter sp. GY 40078 TaxID=2603275 RepID=UPI00164F2523|nr:cupin domain-containing protein [Homoserinibacter sp. GY 40078]